MARTKYIAGTGKFADHGKNFNVYLPSVNIQGQVFIAVTKEQTFGGTASNHIEYSCKLLDVVSPTECSEEVCAISYNRDEEAEGFDPLQFVADHYGAIALPKFQGALTDKINAIRAAASRQKAETILRPRYRETYSGVVGVQLPADLSDPEKARFLEEFNAARGMRYNILDLFAFGSLFTIGVTANRTVHFEQTDDGLRCSTLGCAVLGITAGEIPVVDVPEILFWAVHAAAGMLYEDGAIALLRTRGDAWTPVSNVTGHAAHQVTYEGMWGPGEYLELYVRRDHETFEVMADALRKYDQRYFQVNPNWYRMEGSYAGAYLHRNYKFLS